jgi:hypothetical protein
MVAIQKVLHSEVSEHMIFAVVGHRATLVASVSSRVRHVETP